jgi:hypothetical protein
MLRISTLLAGATFLSVALLMASPVMPAGGPVTSTWGGSTGDWSNRLKWTPTSDYPHNNGSTTYDVIVNAGGVTQDVTVAIQTLTLSGSAFISGTSDGFPTLTCNGLLTWTNGSFLGGGSIEADGGMDISGSGAKIIAHDLLNSAQANWSGADIIIDTTAGFVNLYNSGTFNSQSDAQIQSTPGFATFQNSGTFVKSGGVGSTTFDGVDLDNTGTIQVQSGTIAVNGYVIQMNNVGTLSGGTWIIGANSEFLPDPLLNGDITINQGNITLDGAGSTFTAVNGMIDNQGNFTVSGGRNFTTAGDLSNDGELFIGNGSTFTVGDTGKINGIGKVHVQAGGTLHAQHIVQDTLDFSGTDVDPAVVSLVPGGGGAAGAGPMTASALVPEPSILAILAVAGTCLMIGLHWRKKKSTHNAQSS